VCVPGYAPLRALALVDNVAVLTTWANFAASAQTFSEQIISFLEPGDVVIGISASGNSPYLIAGYQAATKSGAFTIGILGFDGGRALGQVDLPIRVPCDNYGMSEAAHLAIAHALTAAIRQALLQSVMVAP
jgi:D-sedoheptulose 7-phosphate isomerase